MKYPDLKKILAWSQNHPGIFNVREEGDDLLILETYSQKVLRFSGADIQQVEEKKNKLKPQETYLGVVFTSGKQIFLSLQGFAFPPDFSNTGPLSLPSQVYCFQDFHQLFGKLKHLAAESERRREALDLLMVLIALLDGAKNVGLDAGRETREVDAILTQLETGTPLADPHKH